MEDNYKSMIDTVNQLFENTRNYQRNKGVGNGFCHSSSRRRKLGTPRVLQLWRKNIFSSVFGRARRRRGGKGRSTCLVCDKNRICSRRLPSSGFLLRPSYFRMPTPRTFLQRRVQRCMRKVLCRRERDCGHGREIIPRNAYGYKTHSREITTSQIKLQIRRMRFSICRNNSRRGIILSACLRVMARLRAACFFHLPANYFHRLISPSCVFLNRAKFSYVRAAFRAFKGQINGARRRAIVAQSRNYP